MPNKTPNRLEAELIQKMQSTLGKKMKNDGHGDYFEHGAERAFQALAKEIAAVIGAQGPAKTCRRILSVASKIKALGDDGFEDANAIGHAFKDGLGADAPVKARNPLAGMKLR